VVDMKRVLLVFALLLHINFSISQTDKQLDLFFEINKYQLNKEQSAQLDELIGKKYIVTCIKGYADSTGNISSNMDLSRKRAIAVYSYLKERNSIDFNIEPGYFGEQHVIGKDISYNRRVEVCFKENIPGIDVAEKNEKPKDSAATIIEKYELANIYFIPDKAIVEPASFFAVDDAAKYLKKFPGCHFEIVGHVNNVLLPTEENLKALESVQQLSEERAKTVYHLLVERGIPGQNMTHKGVGNTQMVYQAPKNDEEKRKNMRVEILIACKK
jgi:outer membrane protein OmpA-like peptidoglycan-associated protein